MANKKKIDARVLAQQKQKTDKTIQYIGIAVLVLIGLGLAWLLFPRTAPAEAEAPAEP